MGHLSSLRKDDSVMAVALDSEDTPTTNRTSIRNRRIELITGRERRRRWTAEQKREIAAESLQQGVSPVMVARKHGISSGLLYTWRQQLLCGVLGAVADTKPRFVRVDVVAGPPQLEVATPAALELAPPAAPLTSPIAEPHGRIEIMLSGGAKVRVDAQVNEDALRRVLAALGQS
ncbi:MAG TPA: transposase [Stellaceae bacterium]|nr:transposase [Stellaceae bacterium]